MRLIISVMASTLLILAATGYDGYQTSGWLDYPYLGSIADRYPLELGEGRQETINITKNLSEISMPPFIRSQGDFRWSERDELALYHIPAIVDFLSPGYKPPGMNYSGYVPAIGAFLEEDWEPPATNATDYPDWITEFLED
jgi:hypothetical protein